MVKDLGAASEELQLAREAATAHAQEAVEATEAYAAVVEKNKRMVQELTR